MRASTKTRKEHGLPEISVECDDSDLLAPLLNWLLGWLESETANGRQFLPEQTVQIGWSILEIRRRTDSTLALLEPDFASFPAKFIDSVSNTLLHLFLQKSVAESVGLEGELVISGLRSSAIVCNEFGNSNGFIMDRGSPKALDSGWFFGCDNTKHGHKSLENLRLVSLYEAAILHEDRIIPFLGLPPGTFVGLGPGLPYISRGEAELQIRPGSYLYRKYVEKI